MKKKWMKWRLQPQQRRLSWQYNSLPSSMSILCPSCPGEDIQYKTFLAPTSWRFQYFLCFFIENAFHPGRLVVLGVVEDQKWDPKPLHILKRESILRPCPLQVPIFDSVVVPLVPMIKGCHYETLPFKNQSKLEDIVVVHFCDLDDVDDWHGDVDVDRDVDVVHFVKAEGRDLLVVVVLGVHQGFRENLESARVWRKSLMSAHFHWEEFTIVLVWFVETIRSLVAPRMDKVPWLEKNILKYLVDLCTISPKSVNRVCCLLAWFAKIIVGKLAFVPWCWWFFLFAFFAKKNLRILVFNCI